MDERAPIRLAENRGVALGGARGKYSIVEALRRFDRTRRRLAGETPRGYSELGLTLSDGRIKVVDWCGELLYFIADTALPYVVNASATQFARPGCAVLPSSCTR